MNYRRKHGRIELTLEHIKEIVMAFGEQKRKKSGFEVLTRVVILIMLAVTFLGILATALNAFF